MIRTTIRGLFGIALLGAGMTISGGVATAAAMEEHVTIPSSAQGIWRAIDGHMHQLQDLVTKGTLKSVHLHAFAVRDLVRGLSSHSPMLAAAAMAQVNTQSKFVDTLADRLDQSGDANDKAGTQQNLTKLQGVLKGIRSHYPAL